MSVSIFVSHSTSPARRARAQQVQTHARFCRQLCTRLAKERDFVVCVDENIPHGEYWRHILFSRLADCNAAVLLVNEDALRSDWVDTEARLLGWRAWLEGKDFRLLVVPFGGVTRQQIREHKPWQALALGEIQMLPRDRPSLDIDDKAAVTKTLNQIVAAIRTMPSAGSGAETGWIVNTLCSALDVEPASLKKIAAKFEVPVPAGIRERVLRRNLAHKLYSVGPSALDVFLKLPPSVAPNTDLLFLLELLSTSWIDPRASTSILPFVTQESTQRVFAINGAIHHFTPEAYMRQLCDTRSVWPVLAVQEKWGSGEIVAQIRALLKARFQTNFRKKFGPLADSVKPSIVDAWANDLLKNRMDSKLPVFVALSPKASHDPNVIQKIKGKFPLLRIILSSDTEEGAADPFPGVPLIRPELDRAVEAQVYAKYDAMLSEIP